MERKVYIMENLGCANCAAKMEAKFNALPEVEEATITFATKQLRLTAAVKKQNGLHPAEKKAHSQNTAACFSPMRAS